MTMTALRRLWFWLALLTLPLLLLAHAAGQVRPKYGPVDSVPKETPIETRAARADAEFRRDVLERLSRIERKLTWLTENK
jgi:hypothetical protein